MQTTRAAQRVRKDIEEYESNPIVAPRVANASASPYQPGEVDPVAKRKHKKRKSGKRKAHRSKKQKAAARRNIKKAQKAARATARAIAATHAAPPKKRRKKRKTAKRSKRRKTSKRRKGSRRRKSARRRKGSRRSSHSTHSSSRVVKTEKTRVIQVPKKGTQAIHVHLKGGGGKKKSRRKGGRRRRRSNPDTSLVRHSNPGVGGLFSNEGPFTGQKMKNYAVAILAVGLGLAVTDIADRVVATWTPASASNGTAEVEGQRPWYGKNAAAAIRRRPGALRLGVQAAVAVGAVALGYWTRNKQLLSWFFGGLSVGAGARLFESLFVWYAMPMLLKVDPAATDKETIGNRLFSFEQADVQDPIDAAFDAWPQTPALMGAQVISNPVLEGAVPVGLQGLPRGKAGSGSSSGTTGAPRREFISTGRVGHCGSCGGDKGCFSDCGGYKCGGCDKTGCNGGCGEGCGDCEKKCRYMMQPGDDIRAMAAAAGVEMGVLNALNGGAEFNAAPGAWVILPYPMCQPIKQRLDAPNGNGFQAVPPVNFPVTAINPPAGIMSLQGVSNEVNLRTMFDDVEEPN